MDEASLHEGRVQALESRVDEALQGVTMNRLHLTKYKSKRKVKRAPAPAIPCAIMPNMGGLNPEHIFSEHPSRKSAKRALAALILELPRRTLPDEPKRFVIVNKSDFKYVI